MNSALPSSGNPISLEGLLELISGKFSSLIQSATIDRNHVVLHTTAKDLFALISGLKSDRETALNFLVSVTAVDWMDKRDDRFEIVYHLMSLENFGRVRIKAGVPEHNPELDSLTPLWDSANFLEREVWDMYGLTFKGHPDLRRILLYEEFKGHPLRKDYPLQAKQPRVALRYPEVQNTARQMHRPDLVTIKRSGASSRSGGGR